jgi:acyl-CoA synthetase (AMP-forming)/AMP-acid ligase II
VYDQSILENLKTYALKIPDKPALISGTREISYHHLFLLANTMASSLCKLGLRQERLAVHLPNSTELAVIYLGSLIAGAVVVPLSIALKKPEIMTILLETSPKAFIGNSNSCPFFEDFNSQDTSLKYLFSLDEKSLPPFQSLKIAADSSIASQKIPSPLSHDPAAIFYTSGSTSKPKGIIHSESSLTAMMDSMVDSMDLTSEGRFLMSEPMSNCSGYTQALLPLFKGATTIIMPSFSMEALIDAIPYRPTCMSLMGRGNQDIIDAPQLHREHFQGMTLNLSGGDRISKKLMLAFKEKTGIPIRLGYGMSECLLVTVNKSEDAEKMGSVGQAAKNTTIRLLNQNLKPVGMGEEGEVWIKGPNCMLGYWGNPDLTKEVFVNGFMRTGDLARCDVDGFYWLTGRLKHMIIRDGENISPFEIEEVLTKHPSVNAAGVISIPHPEEGAVPIAFVELKKGHKVEEHELIAFAKKNLEDNKVPVAIFILDHLPRTLSGKIARETLRQLHFKEEA